jgi:hypothetical protein
MNFDNLNFDNLSVITTNGDCFTNEEHAVLAFLMLKRLGYNVEVAASKWRNMLDNNCPDTDFHELATRGRTLFKITK